MDAPLWVWGLAGGAGAELLRWFRIRDQLHAGMPDWAKSRSYWVVTTLMVAWQGPSRAGVARFPPGLRRDPARNEFMCPAHLGVAAKT